MSEWATAAWLLADLGQLGVHLEREGDGLRYDAPPGTLTPDLLAALREHKAGLLAELRRGELTADPRPDLGEDSALWACLLAWAYDEHPDLWGALHGFRCWGRRLVRRNGRVELTPGEDDPDYEADRETYLMPHAGALVGLLARLAPDRIGG